MGEIHLRLPLVARVVRFSKWGRIQREMTRSPPKSSKRPSSDETRRSDSGYRACRITHCSLQLSVLPWLLSSHCGLRHLHTQPPNHPEESHLLTQKPSANRLL